MAMLEPEVEVKCDGKDCEETVFLPMRWNTHGYTLSPQEAAKILSSEHDWLTEGDKHYCTCCRIN